MARKSLSLGTAPPAPAGENCDVRDILASVASGQDEDFATMINVLDTAPATGGKARQAVEALTFLHQAFGDNEK